ncbi:hydroxyacylglutathione hydrolase [Natronospira bacteriovora]|uniref:Hydroxyacylglutathione hydrolase n=1 Tax=Natronospira bacteriovora TaxID=3069753 RepID=A0ABU0W5B0_9GAMM|nr:hydroxyacylglutathione hydrolase [Natronospira sp. AB-CW4]MDQ2068953.1 hydroxyacylglutathione hydrolase [Natronospira sp. AB-CW4]
MLEVTPVPTLNDNYVWLLHGRDRRHVAIVDPGEAGPVREALTAQALVPEAILVTHRHWDHVNGIEALLEDYPVPVYGPADEPVPARTQGLSGGDRLALDGLGLEFDVIGIPGHTRGHIAFAGHGLLLSGDTLFSGGCGRMFEGDAEQMLGSLDRLTELPGETLIYCGHEYTLKNLAFCEAVEPANADVIAEFRQRAEARLADEKPSLPTTLAEERRFNVFLRCREPAVRESAEARAGKPLPAASEVFAVIRDWKDRF